MSLKAHPEQELSAHLNGVGALAARFARVFDAESHAHLAGLLHDIGKADPDFQDRVTGKKAEKHPHAPHGAALALRHQLWPIAFAINGHHAGLHNRSALQQVPRAYDPKANDCLRALTESGWLAPAISTAGTLPEWLEKLPSTTAAERAAKMRAVEFYTRMLFSTLIDADRLDTEAANPAAGAQANIEKRSSWRFGELALAAPTAIDSLQVLLDNAITDRIAKARAKQASEAVLAVRAEVLAACRERALLPRGVFSLTVPTGGGKTLASLAFALTHAKARGLRRIIFVIPYLNIIQQTTKELAAVLGHTDEDSILLEHHSQASDPEIANTKDGADIDAWDQERPLRQLAAENWDAPIIVTTSVQFFDSLFSRRPSDARKLHNICQSVVVFDEVQSLPPLLLQPILDALQELASPARPYGCSLVLCTATQPALNESDDLPVGFPNTIEINTAATDHFRRLERVTYRGLAKDNAPAQLTNYELATALLATPNQQALAILNTRKQARALFDTLRATAQDVALASAVFHLSTWMYPAHRLQVLAEVTRRLAIGKPCLLVSTQCVEAGVDVDFPAVWRAFGPYDSIVQAAGRCNRNGAMKDSSGARILGTVTVFTPADDTSSPGGVYEAAMQNADLLRRMGKAAPSNPDSFDLYFRLLYQTTVPDIGGCAIQTAREQLHFESVSELFHFIDADTAPLLIESAIMPDGRTVDAWRQEVAKKGFFTRDEWRQLQPYIVGLAHPTSAKTRTFLLKTNSELVFSDDDPVRGLRRAKTTGIYLDGLQGAGLDLTCAALSDLQNFNL